MAFPDLMTVRTTPEFQARVDRLLVDVEYMMAHARHGAAIGEHIAQLKGTLALIAAGQIPDGVLDVRDIHARLDALLQALALSTPADQVTRVGLRQVPLDLVAAAVLQEYVTTSRAPGREPTDDEVVAALVEIVRRNPFHGSA